MTDPPSTLDGALAVLRWLGDPRPSPAGDRVAYVQTWLDVAGDTVASRVGVVPVAGGDTVWLGPGDSPRWSPDGRRLVVCRRDGAGPSELWLVEFDPGDARHWGGARPGEARQLTAGPDGWASEPAWSPDGERIGYTRTYRTESLDGVRVDGLPGLYQTRRTVQVVDLHGTPQWTVDGDAYHPQWTPDGSRLAFLTTRFGPRPDLCWTDGERIVRVTDGAGPVRGYAWSPDGGTLAYLGHRHGDAADANLRLWTVGVRRRRTGRAERGLAAGAGQPGARRRPPGYRRRAGRLVGGLRAGLRRGVRRRSRPARLVRPRYRRQRSGLRRRARLPVSGGGRRRAGVRAQRSGQPR